MTTRHGARAGLDIQTHDSHQICSQSWRKTFPSSLGILNYIRTNNCQNSTISTVQFAFKWNFQLIGPPASAGYKDWYIYLLQPCHWWVRQWGHVQLQEPISTLWRYFKYICLVEGGLVVTYHRTWAETLGCSPCNWVKVRREDCWHFLQWLAKTNSPISVPDKLWWCVGCPLGHSDWVALPLHWWLMWGLDQIWWSPGFHSPHRPDWLRVRSGLY